MKFLNEQKNHLLKSQDKSASNNRISQPMIYAISSKNVRNILKGFVHSLSQFHRY